MSSGWLELRLNGGRLGNRAGGAAAEAPKEDAQSAVVMASAARLRKQPQQLAAKRIEPAHIPSWQGIRCDAHYDAPFFRHLHQMIEAGFQQQSGDTTTILVECRFQGTLLSAEAER